jgi:hypothetical protein
MSGQCLTVYVGPATFALRPKKEQPGGRLDPKQKRKRPKRKGENKVAIRKTEDQIGAEEFWEGATESDNLALLQNIARLRQIGVDVEKVLDEIDRA